MTPQDFSSAFLAEMAAITPAQSPAGQLAGAAWTLGLTALTLGLLALLSWRLWQRAKALQARSAKLEDTAREQEVLQLVMNNVSDGLLYQEMDATIIWANPAYCEIVGRELHEIVGRKPQEFVFPERHRMSAEEIANFRHDPNEPVFDGLERKLNVRKNGEEFWHEFNLSVVEPTPGDPKVVLVSRDVTAHVKQEEELAAIRQDLQHAACHDSLTGLVNRTEFQRLVDLHIQGTSPALGLLQLDLDKFKAINDTRGHEAGDRVLQHVADAIRAVLRPGDIACRLGGDEFVVALPGIDAFDDLTNVAKRLSQSISEPLTWRDEQLQAGTSIGISACSQGATSPDDLMRHADFALYEAKTKDRTKIACYDAELHARRKAEKALVAEFNVALDKNDLTFAFQPIIDGTTIRCVGFETLARWTTADGVPIAPPRFIEFAQRLRRKPEIDLAAMRAAIQMAANAAAQGHCLRATFNASTETLLTDDFVAELEWEADRLSVDRDCVTVEVLETTFFGHETSGNAAARTITALRKSGFTVMLDDFGVGYAGLSHLDKLDVSGLKIDRSLVVSATEIRSSRLIVNSLLSLCRDLGLMALAEGIETEAQARHFIDVGCELMQGYVFGRPMPEGEFLSYVSQQTKSSHRSSVA